MRLRQHEASQIEDSKAREAAFVWGCRGESQTRIAHCLKLATARPTLADSGDNWDQQPHLIGCANGVIDLRRGTLAPGRPEDRLSLSTRVAYDPAARSELWERVLRQCLPHRGLPEYLQRCLGYSITGDISLDKWFMGHGGGRNGKDTIYGAVFAALGDYALELPAETLAVRGKTYDLANLPGRRFVTSSEAGDTLTLNHDLLKKLTGGATQRAANKYEKSFEFNPQCHLWLACNKKPGITDDSIGFWERVVVIPFTAQFLASDADPSIRTSLRDPHQPHQRAILTWLVQGATLALREGLGDVPDVVQQATSEYRNESGPLAAFIADECIEQPRACARASALRQRYVDWVNRTHDRGALNPKAFAQALRQRFVAEDRRDGIWYLGVGLLEQPEGRSDY